MSIDKSWTKLNNHLSDEYWCGTEEFINLASRHLNFNRLITCPSKKMFESFMGEV